MSPHGTRKRYIPTYRHALMYLDNRAEEDTDAGGGCP